MDTSPARIWSAAIMMAFMPEPHILLMVVVGTPFGMPAPSAAWRAGRLAQARGQHAAHDDFLHVARRRSPRRRARP